MVGQAALAGFLASDIVVVDAPMDFTIPSQLKSWIDRITVAGQTFQYGPEGVQGLAGGRKVIIVSTRGGRYGPETLMGTSVFGCPSPWPRSRKHTSPKH